MATLAELDSCYGIEDLHDMIEIAAVEAANRVAAQAGDD